MKTDRICNMEDLSVYRLTQEAYDALRLEATDNPAIYLDPQTDFSKVLKSKGIESYVERTGIVCSESINLIPVSSGAPNRADHQALDFYKSLDGLNPSTASDGRMWAWITHFRLHSYSLERWRRRSGTDIRAYITDHWFIENRSDSLWKNNTASRTWWMAHTATKAASASGGAFTAGEALDHFANHAEHYHAIMKVNVLRHSLILAEFVRVLLTGAQGVKDNGVYELLRRVNLMAGTRFLDLLTRDELRDMIEEHVESVMSNESMVSDRTKVRNVKALKVLSLGAGVQSTVMALMAERGAYGLSPPDFAIFADTGWEPPAVYEHLKWLKKQLSYEVKTVKAGDLRGDVLRGTDLNGRTFMQIPVYLTNQDGTNGFSLRRCTSDYKISPIQNYLREHLNLTPKRRAPLGVKVDMWLGISADEALRQKPSRVEWINNCYPLIDFSRAQLYAWFMRNYPGKELPRSACIGCPYRTNSEWKWLKDNDIDSFQDAVMVDNALRTNAETLAAIKGKAFLHNSRMPLSEVDFDSAASYEDVMAEECEGVCGL